MPAGSRVEHYDFIALGGGNAGLAASRRIRSAGKKVALIDPTPIGGLCPLRGCNPKKVLVRAVEMLHLAIAARGHGVSTGQVTLDWSAVIDRKHRFTDPVTQDAQESLLDADIDYIRAPARFTAPARMEVDSRTLEFDGAVVATGSSPRRLAFAGAAFVTTSDEILERREVPARLAIVGAGAVAFEFAHIYARLGSHVHVLSRGHEALKSHERDLVSRLVAHLQRLGVVFHYGVEVRAVEAYRDAYSVHLSDGAKVEADVVLNAAGRPANLEGLGLEAAHVRYGEHGVEVDACLRSAGNSRIFAAGDAHGRRELSPVATYEGEIVAHNFLNSDQKQAEYGAIPSAIFTVPPLAMVGLTEAQARERGLEVEAAMHDMSGWTVYRIEGEQPAYGKVISEKGSGRIVGAHLFGPAADDHIHVFAMAMRYGITRERLSEMIYVYPALASAMRFLT